jgi:hypothetical protein
MKSEYNNDTNLISIQNNSTDNNNMNNLITEPL